MEMPMARRVSGQLSAELFLVCCVSFTVLINLSRRSVFFNHEMHQRHEKGAPLQWPQMMKKEGSWYGEAAEIEMFDRDSPAMRRNELFPTNNHQSQSRLSRTSFS